MKGEKYVKFENDLKRNLAYLYLAHNLPGAQNLYFNPLSNAPNEFQ